MTQSNPWDIPDPLPVGDLHPDTLFRSVGHALSQWEMLEDELANLFASLCATQSLAAKLAFGVAVSHSTRTSMLDAAARSHFYGRPSEAKSAVALINRVGQLSGRRNDIAHGCIKGFDQKGTGFSGFYLCPPSYQSRKAEFSSLFKFDAVPSLGRKYQLMSTQINAFASAFLDVRDEVTALWRSILETLQQTPDTPQ